MITFNEKKFGKMLHIHRTNAELTQEALAGMVSIESNYLSTLERGKGTPSIPLIYQLASVLNCNPHDFIPVTKTDREFMLPNDIRILLSNANDADRQKVYNVIRCLLSN